MPGECQQPMHRDRVCLGFPNLRICMAHGADPWWSVAIRLMLKSRHLQLMTSAYLPKRLPPELDLREGVLDKYLCSNAEALFFTKRRPRA